MEEIEKLVTRGLDEYLVQDKYVQVEDLITACGVNITSSLAGIIEDVYEVKGTGKVPDLKQIAQDIQIIVQHVGIIAHCLEMNLPELEQIEEYAQDEMTIESRMDALIAAMGMQQISSSMVLEYFAGIIDGNGDEELWDYDIIDSSILEMLAHCYALCLKYKLDFTKIVVYGENL